MGLFSLELTPAAHAHNIVNHKRAGRSRHAHPTAGKAQGGKELHAPFLLCTTGLALML